MAYCVVRTDLMSGTTDPSCLEHGRFYNAHDAQEAIQNGSIVQVGDLEAGERESHKYTDVAAGAVLNDVVLIAEPELITDTSHHKGIADYISPAGKIIRGYRLHQFDEFSVSAEGFTSATRQAAQVGAYVSVAEGTHMLAASARKPDTGLYIGKIIDVEVKNFVTYYCIAVYGK